MTNNERRRERELRKRRRSCGEFHVVSHKPGAETQGDDYNVVDVSFHEGAADQSDDSEERNALDTIFAEIEHEIEMIAQDRGLIARPKITNKTTKRLRCLVVKPIEREEARQKRLDILWLRTCDEEGEEENELYRHMQLDLLDEIIDIEFMPESLPKEIGLRKTSIPCFCSVDEAFAKLNDNVYLFTQIFSGFYPNEVKEMAHELFLYEKLFKIEGTRYSVEECMLVLLARMKLTIGTFELMEWMFQRASSSLIEIFRDVVMHLLNNYFSLVTIEHFDRFKNVVPVYKEKILEKYQKVMNNPNANLPSRFRGVGAFMDGSKFMISAESHEHWQ